MNDEAAIKALDHHVHELNALIYELQSVRYRIEIDVKYKGDKDGFTRKWLEIALYRPILITGEKS